MPRDAAGRAFAERRVFAFLERELCGSSGGRDKAEADGGGKRARVD